MTLSTGQTLHNNRYRIVKLIGQGGFGAVYRAWDTVLNQPAALKENLDVGPEAQRQFEREATLMAGLRHPNLPRVIDHFFIPGQGQYLVMDFVEGSSIAALLEAQNGRPFSEVEVLPWLQQVCNALDYLHNRQPPIIHRDVKPENIIITPEGQAMLVDFGLSKIYDVKLATTVGARAVTPGYSPPEQYGAGKTDGRTDIYALGATLYRILTGQEPPPSVDIVAGATVLTPPRQLNQQIKSTTEQAVLQAMSVNMSQRFNHAADFLKAIEPTSALTYPLSITNQPTQPVHLSSPVSREKIPGWAWWLGGLLLLLSVLGIGFSQSRTNPSITNNLPTTSREPDAVGDLLTEISTATATSTPFPEVPNNWQYGTVINSVMPGLPADEAGFEEGDIVVAVNSTPIDEGNTFADLIQEQPPESEVMFWIVRPPDTVPFLLTATLVEHPDDAGRGYLGVTHSGDNLLDKVAIVNTPTPAPTLVFAPRDTVTLGRDGWSSTECSVIDPDLSMTQAELFEDGYIYVAMPIQPDDYSKVLLWSVYSPDGSVIYDHIERELTAENYEDDCFQQGFTLDFSSNPGVYTIELVLDGTQIFLDQLNILEAVIPTPVSLDPLGDFTFGRDGLGNECVVYNQTDQVRKTDLENDQWLYFASTYSSDQIGDTLIWTVYEPNGDVNVSGTRELELQPELCFWQGFAMLKEDPIGKYTIEIEHKGTTTVFRFELLD
ncbi:MAG: protein kinase [Chloroflexi bacterium]|nr:protein kinase [Chloroflexota bacterium]